MEKSKDKFRVLLVNPTFDRAKNYGQLNRLVSPGLPLSLGALGGYLEAKGIEVKIVDDQVDELSPANYRSLLFDFSPDIAGLTCLTPNVARVFELAGQTKKYSGVLWVVLGGAHPTIRSEECINNPYVDFVVRQEGEVTLWELCRLKAKDGIRKEDILGLCFKDNGRMIQNSDRPFEKNLDAFPRFAYHLLMTEPGRYNPGHIVTSRGCPYKCIFCSSRSISGFTYRSLSPGRVIEEIEGLINTYGVSSLMFEDDNFLVDKKRAAAICQAMIDKGLSKKVSWRCQARADLVTQDILKKMKEAGCVNISFGIETASQRLMDFIKKGETVEDNVRAVKMAHAAGLGTRGAFILGLPTETRKESLQTIKFAKELPLDEVKFSLATPYPGSELYDAAKKEGCIIEGNWERLNTTVGLGSFEPLYCPKGRTPQELKRLQRRAHLEFYLRPKIILSLFDPSKPDNITSLPRIKDFGVFMKYLKTLLGFVSETFSFGKNKKESLSVDELYPRSYLLSEKCEGYERFTLDKGLSYVKSKEAAVLDPQKGERILDVGCGRGEFLYHCAQKGALAFGVEYSSDAVNLAKETLGAKGFVVKAKAGELPFADASFDKIIMADVLEHLTAAESGSSLKEMVRVCKKGGVVLIHTAPNLNFVRFSGVLRLLLTIAGKRKIAAELKRKLKEAEGRHINVQSPSSFKRFIKRSNRDFKVWIDADILRSGESKFTQDIHKSKLSALIKRLEGFGLVKYLLGNDLWARINA